VIDARQSTTRLAGGTIAASSPVALSVEPSLRFTYLSPCVC
jgi:hypothetical protein